MNAWILKLLDMYLYKKVSVADALLASAVVLVAFIAARLVSVALERGFPAKTLLNVNCPDRPWEELRGARVTTLGRRVYGDKVEHRATSGKRRQYLCGVVLAAIEATIDHLLHAAA